MFRFAMKLAKNKQLVNATQTTLRNYKPTLQLRNQEQPQNQEQLFQDLDYFFEDPFLFEFEEDLDMFWNDPESLAFMQAEYEKYNH